MIKKRGFFSPLVFALLISLGGLVQASDLYWVSGGGNSSSDEVFILQIDETGRVTIPLTTVPGTQLGNAGSSTTISHGKPGKIIMWIASIPDVFRVIINKSDLTNTKARRTGLTTPDNDQIQATESSVLAIETTNSILRGFDMLQNGFPEGTSFRLAPVADGDLDEGGISPDGTLAFATKFGTNQDQLYLQLLNSNHRPEGNPRMVASALNIDSVDVTKPLTNGKRFIVYLTDATEEVFLQVVDPSLQKIGGKKLINSVGTVDNDQAIAIDPLGRFVLHTINIPSCPDLLVAFQALDSAGNPVGPTKQIIECGTLPGQVIQGIDILME